VDPESVGTVFATLGSVFPHVEAWCTLTGDMLLVAAMQPITIDVALLQQRVTVEPFRSALVNAWGVDSAEGMLSRFMLNEGFARACLEAEAPISTDDRNHLEFGFARHVGHGAVGDWDAQIHALSRRQKWHRPLVTNGEVDWAKVDAHRFSRRAQADMKTEEEPGESEASKHRREWMNLCAEDQLRGAGEYWHKHPIEPLNPFETQMLALALATIKSPEATRYIDAARALRRADGDALDAMVYAMARQSEPAVAALERAFAAWRSDPWSEVRTVQRTLNLASELIVAAKDAALAERIYVATREPFAAYALDTSRLTLAMAAAAASGPGSAAKVRGIMEKLEPNPIWTGELLDLRAKTYRATQHPRLAEALSDFRELLRRQVPKFDEPLKLTAEKAAAPAKPLHTRSKSGVNGAATPAATAPPAPEPSAAFATSTIGASPHHRESGSDGR
jgi:hypothetical protein